MHPQITQITPIIQVENNHQICVICGYVRRSF
jgi:hypothetical protein